MFTKTKSIFYNNWFVIIKANDFTLVNGCDWNASNMKWEWIVFFYPNLKNCLGIVLEDIVQNLIQISKFRKLRRKFQVFFQKLPTLKIKSSSFEPAKLAQRYFIGRTDIGMPCTNFACSFYTGKLVRGTNNFFSVRD